MLKRSELVPESLLVRPAPASFAQNFADTLELDEEERSGLARAFTYGQG
jgi:hypothetical protein